MKFLKLSAEFIIKILVAVAQAILPFLKKNDNNKKTN